MFTTLDMHILEILCEDARVTPREIAVMTGSDEATVQAAIEALRRAGVPFELHLFERGGHGMSLCNALTASAPKQIMPDNAVWLERAVRFLSRR